MGGIGTWALALDYNQINGSVGKVFTAFAPYAGVIERGGITQDNINQMSVVPVFAVSGAGDTTSNVQDWNQPLWQALAGNSNYPSAPGAEGRIVRLHHYLQDPSLSHAVGPSLLRIPGRPGPIFDWLFAQRGTTSGSFRRSHPHFCIKTGNAAKGIVATVSGPNGTTAPFNPGQASAPTIVAPAASTGITVTAGTGFYRFNRKSDLASRGLNGLVADALQAFPAIMTDYPGMTAIRLNALSDSDSASDIAQVVQEYNAANVVVEIEDHSGNQDNVAWYQQLASQFQNSPLVFLEVPNEPDDDLSVTPQNQIDIINAIRAAGFTNPIGIQAMGGFDESNYSVVTAAVGTTQLYAAPHEYYYGTDPNGAQQYLDELVGGAQAVGLFPWLDEFGNDAGDGVSPAPQGMSVITDIITENEAGTVAAAFWSHGQRGPSRRHRTQHFLHPDGTQLTPIGINPLQPWLSQTSGTPTSSSGSTSSGGGTVAGSSGGTTGGTGSSGCGSSSGATDSGF